MLFCYLLLTCDLVWFVVCAGWFCWYVILVTLLLYVLLWVACCCYLSFRVELLGGDWLLVWVGGLVVFVSRGGWFYFIDCGCLRLRLVGFV